MKESGENYLETILILQNKNGYVRSIDIANELDYSKPSISRAMSILKEDGFITIEDSGRIILTEKGNEKAKGIYERHRIIKKFFMNYLSIDEKIAELDACRIEHVISQETFDKIKSFTPENKE